MRWYNDVRSGYVKLDMVIEEESRSFGGTLRNKEEDCRRRQNMALRTSSPRRQRRIKTD